jgi:enoyl reductase-like protein
LSKTGTKKKIEKICINPLFEESEKGKVIKELRYIFDNNIFSEKDYIDNDIMATFHITYEDIKKMSYKEYMQKILYLKIKKEDYEYKEVIKRQCQIF